MTTLARKGTCNWVLLVGLVATAGLETSPARAADLMPVNQQNSLVQTYCAVCHTDRARNGGLSLEHFDAATVSPSLAAMMLSKIAGLSLDTLRAAPSHPDARTLVVSKMRSGAMNAAGVPPPPEPTTLALIAALTSRTTSAGDWTLEREAASGATARTYTASILKELASAGGEADMYRLVVTCDAATRQGAVQLNWAPLPKLGTLVTTVDEQPPVTYVVEGIESMGNGGNGKTTGRASVVLSKMTTLPASVLTVDGLFGRRLAFPFSQMAPSVREPLSACFTGTH